MHPHDHLAPERPELQHVGLVDRTHRVAPSAGERERVACNALDLWCGVHDRIDGALRAVRQFGDPTRLTEIGTPTQLAHDHHVDPARHLGPQRRCAEQRLVGADRAQVLIQDELLAHLEQPVDLALFGRDVGVSRCIDRAEQDRVGVDDVVPRLIGHQRTVLLPRASAERLLVDVGLYATFGNEPLDDPHCLGDDLGADTVAGKDQQLGHKDLLGRSVIPRAGVGVGRLELRECWGRA